MRSSVSWSENRQAGHVDGGRIGAAVATCNGGGAMQEVGSERFLRAR